MKENCPNIIFFQDICSEYPTDSYNLVQLRLFAGAHGFINSNRSLAILASYFKGHNIIFSKVSRENDNAFPSFYQRYPLYGNSTLSVAINDNELMQDVRERWVEKLPHFSVLIRTSKRPNYFGKCIQSIKSQVYRNYSVIISTDDRESWHYIQNQKAQLILQEKTSLEQQPSDYLSENELASGEFGFYFPFNKYFDKMYEKCRGDYILHLDDDDDLSDQNAFLELATNIGERKNIFPIWRVQFPGTVIPSFRSWGIKPALKDISGIGYLVPTTHIENWRPWKLGDFRLANSLHNNPELETRWINQIYTRVRSGIDRDGLGKQDDLANREMRKIKPITITLAFIITKVDPLLIPLLAKFCSMASKAKKLKIILIVDPKSRHELHMLSFISHIKNCSVIHPSKLNQYGLYHWVKGVLSRIQYIDEFSVVFNGFPLSAINLIDSQENLIDNFSKLTITNELNNYNKSTSLWLKNLSQKAYKNVCSILNQLDTFKSFPARRISFELFNDSHSFLDTNIISNMHSALTNYFATFDEVPAVSIDSNSYDPHSHSASFLLLDYHDKVSKSFWYSPKFPNNIIKGDKRDDYYIDYKFEYLEGLSFPTLMTNSYIPQDHITDDTLLNLELINPSPYFKFLP